MRNAVLVYLIGKALGGETIVCLPIKKTGPDFLVGKRNGYGGEINTDETPIEAVRRELREESGINIINPHEFVYTAKILYREWRPADVKYEDVYEVTVFMISVDERKPEETAEMGKPEWFPSVNLPFSEMMPADRWMIPLYLSGNIPFRATIFYLNGKEKVVGINIRQWESCAQCTGEPIE